MCIRDSYTPHQPSGNLLLYFHGGGLEGGDKSDLNLMPEMLTDQGITLVSANYRMYPEARFPDYVDAVSYTHLNALRLLLDAFAERLNFKLAQLMMQARQNRLIFRP